jgi:hypothetical protein
MSTIEVDPVDAALPLPIPDRNFSSKKKDSVRLDTALPAVKASWEFPIVITVDLKKRTVVEIQLVASEAEPPIRAINEYAVCRISEPCIVSDCADDIRRLGGSHSFMEGMSYERAKVWLPYVPPWAFEAVIMATSERKLPPTIFPSTQDSDFHTVLSLEEPPTRTALLFANKPIFAPDSKTLALALPTLLGMLAAIDAASRGDKYVWRFALRYDMISVLLPGCQPAVTIA